MTNLYDQDYALWAEEMAQETGLAFPEECSYSIQDVIEKKVDF